MHRRTKTNFNKMFSFAFASTLLLLLVGPDDSIAKIASPSKPSHEIFDFVQLHPRMYVEQLTTTTTVNGTMIFTLGTRIAGDNLVGHAAKNQTWPTQQHVSVTLSYPTSGVGKQITFVKIEMDNSSNLGQAYVVRGGLHQRYIAIVVEAFTTLYLNYDVQIYGV